MEKLANSILAAIVSGAITGMLTLTALRQDVSWLKEILSGHDQRLTYLERKVIK